MKARLRMIRGKQTKRFIMRNTTVIQNNTQHHYVNIFGESKNEYRRQLIKDIKYSLVTFFIILVVITLIAILIVT